MATYADTLTEVKRLHRIPGIVARPRLFNPATLDYRIWVKDGRGKAEQQLEAAGTGGNTIPNNPHPGTWTKTIIPITTNLTDV
jgi:hypothetical protein